MKKLKDSQFAANKIKVEAFTVAPLTLEKSRSQVSTNIYHLMRRVIDDRLYRQLDWQINWPMGSAIYQK